MNNLNGKDWRFGAIIGFLIGLLFLPVFRTASPELFAKMYLLVVPFFLIGAPLGLFVAKIISAKIPVIWQIAKFAVIGVLNSFVDLGILSGLSLFAQSTLSVNTTDMMFFSLSYYSLFKTASFIVSNMNSYFWNKHWTFENGKRMDHAGFLQFFAVSLVGLLFNVFAASVVFRLGAPSDAITSGQWGLIAALAGIFAGLVWNFVGYKFVVFKV